MKKKRGPTLSLRAKGPLAIFTRPELKTERVSYEVPTPSAVRGIFEAICWKPAIQWHVERIYVFNEICFNAIKRNELNSKSIMPSGRMMDCGMREFTHGIYGINVEPDRAQRNTVALRNVDYQFEAFFTLTDKAGPEDNIFKFIDMFSRRLEKGQHFHQPYFGCRECIAEIHPPIGSPKGRSIPVSKELGLMLWDVEFGGVEARQNTPLFFNAKLENGKMEIPLYPIGREEAS
ncbi:MAG: type I-C CRISPR-associated protein Cas5c [Desulfobacterales bacterium]|nr:type I-C CRISPR-associated protein Cas5c [Desulfobacterales bacterium]MDD4391488.1 type I-C CRISPR-associated protein Cas5c [Desulfobacterales bacterium]